GQCAHWFFARRRSAVPGVRLPVGRDLVLVPVADRKQHLLGEVEVAALLAVVLEDVGLDDGIDGTGFFAESAEDALGEVDVITGGAPGAVFALGRLDGDRQRGADRLAELAGDAALLAVRIASQGVQAPEARRHRRFLFGELQGDLPR